MKSLEIRLNEGLGRCTESQVNKFYKDCEAAVLKTGKPVPLESQVHMVEGVRGQRVSFNNGASFSESASASASSNVTDLQQRQIVAYKRQGHDQVSAEVMAGVHESALRIAIHQGKTPQQFIESLRKK